MDEDEETSHGTTVASLALGQFHGVAKSATLVPVKFTGPLSDMAMGIRKAVQDIEAKGRQLNSIVVLTVGEGRATDPATDIENSLAAGDTYQLITKLHSMGVPVVTPAGNDRKEGRDRIDFWPSHWDHAELFPLINVAEADLDGMRSEFSQAGDQVTTWAASYGAWVMFKNGDSEQEAGTSLGKCGRDVLPHVITHN